MACTVTSLPYKPYTQKNRTPVQNCSAHSFAALVAKNLKQTIDIDNLSDGLQITALTLELYAEDCAVHMPKLEFYKNKILAERFFNNPSNDILLRTC